RCRRARTGPVAPRRRSPQLARPARARAGRDGGSAMTTGQTCGPLPPGERLARMIVELGQRVSRFLQGGGRRRRVLGAGPRAKERKREISVFLRVSVSSVSLRSAGISRFRAFVFSCKSRKSLILCFSVFASVSTAPARATVLSRSTEISMGREAAQEYERTESVDADPVLAARVRRIGNRLIAVFDATQYPFEFHEVETNEINAFAL